VNVNGIHYPRAAMTMGMMPNMDMGMGAWCLLQSPETS
jgi:hypothetical protein